MIKVSGMVICLIFQRNENKVANGGTPKGLRQISIIRQKANALETRDGSHTCRAKNLSQIYAKPHLSMFAMTIIFAIFGLRSEELINPHRHDIYRINKYIPNK